MAVEGGLEKVICCMMPATCRQPSAMHLLFVVPDNLSTTFRFGQVATAVMLPAFIYVQGENKAALSSRIAAHYSAVGDAPNF